MKKSRDVHVCESVNKHQLYMCQVHKEPPLYLGSSHKITMLWVQLSKTQGQLFSSCEYDIISDHKRKFTSL